MSREQWRSLSSAPQNPQQKSKDGVTLAGTQEGVVTSAADRLWAAKREKNSLESTGGSAEWRAADREVSSAQAAFDSAHAAYKKHMETEGQIPKPKSDFRTG